MEAVVMRQAATDGQLLTAEEVVRILRIDQHAPRAPREALRNLVRRGRLQCLRIGPGKRGRMVFLRRHLDECLARWEQWGGCSTADPDARSRQNAGRKTQ